MPYLRGSDGTVYLYEEQPKFAWTADEWAAEIARLRAELAGLEEELASYSEPVGWPEEALSLWREVNGHRISALQSQMENIKTRLAEMEKV